MRGFVRASGVLFIALFLSVASGCAHKKKKPGAFDGEDLDGKRVALTEIQASEDVKNLVEVALVNQIIDQGNFEIVDRATVRKAQVEYPAESDWQKLGKKVGADYVLSVRVAQSSIETREGFDKIQEEDSVLQEERHESSPVIGERFVKVKALDGEVKLDALFFSVAENAIRHKVSGQAKETLNSRDGALPGKEKFLERLTSAAVQDLFRKLLK